MTRQAQNKSISQLLINCDISITIGVRQLLVLSVRHMLNEVEEKSYIGFPTQQEMH